MVYTDRAETGSSFTWHQPCQRCTTSVEIQKRAIKKTSRSCRITFECRVCSRAENSAIQKRSTNNGWHGFVDGTSVTIDTTLPYTTRQYLSLFRLLGIKWQYSRKIYTLHSTLPAFYTRASKHHIQTPCESAEYYCPPARGPNISNNVNSLIFKAVLDRSGRVAIEWRPDIRALSLSLFLPDFCLLFNINIPVVAKWI